MCKNRLFILSVILSGLFCLNSHAQEIGKITNLQGRVDYFKANEHISTSARERDGIQKGDSVRTKSDARAEIRFRDNSEIRLAPNSKITIEDYQINDSGRVAARIKLERGRLYSSIAKSSTKAPFDIITPNATGKVTGSQILTSFEAGNSTMLVLEGNMLVASTLAPEKPVSVHSGNITIVPAVNSIVQPRPFSEIEKKMLEDSTRMDTTTQAKLSPSHATLSKIVGTVLVTAKGETKSHKATRDEVLKEGFSITTTENSFAQIKLANNNALDLKPKSTITILRLTYNETTGEYDNTFELNLGGVKARIEKLKDNSKFEVKTPTAICGARGTILFVRVLPDGKTFMAVEGGNGYISNVITGNSKDVGGGSQSSTDNQGGVTDPEPLDEGTRGDLDNEFEGDGDHGDTGDTGGDPLGTFGEDNNNQQNNNQNNAGNNNQIDIPPTDDPNQNDEPGTEPVTLGSGFEGGIGYFSTYSGDLRLSCADIWNGILSGENIDITQAQPISLNANHDFTCEVNEHLWSIDMAYSLENGTSYVGVAGGIKLGDLLRGLSYMIYIRPDGEGFKTGFVSSTDLLGSFNPTSLVANGTLTPPDFEFPTDIPSDSLFDAIDESDEGKGAIDGHINGVMNLSSIQLSGQNWGIWKAACGGSSNQEFNSSVWTANFGGRDGEEKNRSYWIGQFIGNEWGNNQLSALAAGYFLSDNNFGIFTGNLIGLYDDGDGIYWEGLAGGSYYEYPLITKGNLSLGLGSYSSEEEALIMDNSIDALYGGFGQPYYTEEHSFIVMGDYNNPDDLNLWAQDDFRLDAYDSFTETNTEVAGFMGGIKQLGSDSLKGLLSALYIRTAGSDVYYAGYLKSNDLNGYAYPELELFEMFGDSVSVFEHPTTYSSLTEAIIENDLDYGLIGNNDDFRGTLEMVSMRIEDQDWSIWRFAAGGEYETQPQESWSAVITGSTYNKKLGGQTSYWYGKVEGSDSWNGDEFEADVSGLSLDFETLSDFSGKMLGVYENGSWEAYGTGVATLKDPLTSSGSFDASFLYDGGDLLGDFNPIFNGLLGITGSLWQSESNPTLVSIGKFDSGSLPNFLWYNGNSSLGGFYSHYYQALGERGLSHYTTYNDGNGVGAFFGLAAGVGTNGKLKGTAYALYEDSNQNAGIFYAPLDGDYSDIAEAYQLSGPITVFNPLQELDILPENLYDHIQHVQLAGYEGTGQFLSGGDLYAGYPYGNSLSITDQTWGIWNMVTTGTFYGETSDIWKMNIAAKEFASYEDSHVQGAVLVEMNGTQWSNNELSATANAIWLHLNPDGSLTGRTMAAETTGNYIEVDVEQEGNNQWQSASVGQWAGSGTIENFIDTPPSQDEIIQLASANNVHLNTACPDVAMGGQAYFGDGMGIDATMETRFYQGAFIDNGIWAALISGEYFGGGPTDPNSWTINLQGEGSNATIQGSSWVDGQWQASVSGSTNQGINFSGGANGTYSQPIEGSGTLSGTAVGTWEQNPL